jgi:O-methyltransferase domain
MTLRLDLARTVPYDVSGMPRAEAYLIFFEEVTMSAHSEALPGPSQRMGSLLSGHLVAECVHAIAVLGVADLLAGGPATIESLASATGCHAPSLQRVLRILVRLGVFTETVSGQFELTPLGATLRSDTPDSLRDAAVFLMSAPMWTAFGSLLDTLRSGDPAFVRLHKATIFEYLGERPELSAVFHDFMTTQSNAHNAAIVDAYDFSGIHRVVDVGGGHGATLAAVLHRYPAMKGILFDLPEVVANAGPETQRDGRCEVVGGDMLLSVPAGGDAYMIKRVIMDRCDGEAKTILSNCLSGMNAGGRIVVIDPMLPDHTEPHPNWLADLFGLAITGGQCRSEAEFRNLFDAAGLRLTRVVATRSPNFILEGVRAAA